MTTDFPHDKAPASPAPVTAVPYLTAASIKAMTDEQFDAALEAVEENQRRLLDEVNARNGGWLGVDDFLDACDYYAFGKRVHEDVRAWQYTSTREAYTAFVHALLLLRLPAGVTALLDKQVTDACAGVRLEVLDSNGKDTYHARLVQASRLGTLAVARLDAVDARNPALFCRRGVFFCLGWRGVLVCNAGKVRGACDCFCRGR